MSDKKELKNDEIVESSNKSDEKLVSRAGTRRLQVTNNTSEIICISIGEYVTEYAAGCSNVLTSWLDDCDTVEVYAKTSGLSISAQLYKAYSSTLTKEWTNQKIITIDIFGDLDFGYSPLIITSVEVPIPPTLYLNESYSVPNFVDPVPPEIYVWVSNVRLIENVLFTDSSNNIITPTESEVVSTISSNEHIFSFTFALNAPISKIFIAGYDQSAAANEAQRYENTDFTGFLMSSYDNTGGMTYEGKYYMGYTLPSGTKSFKLTSWMY